MSDNFSFQFRSFADRRHFSIVLKKKSIRKKKLRTTRVIFLFLNYYIKVLESFATFL